MATFTSTTLTKRTGATSTTFVPMELSNDVGYLRESAASAGFGPYISMKQVYAGNARRTTVRVGIPQLNSSGDAVLYRPSGMMELYIPNGTVQTDVDDIVGYLNALSATGVTNFNDLLVNGVGVYG